MLDSQHHKRHYLTKIPFRGYADEKPGVEPGDVVIVIMEKEHHLFQRKGNELIVKLNISLSEALTGFWNGFSLLGLFTWSMMFDS